MEHVQPRVVKWVSAGLLLRFRGYFKNFNFHFPLIRRWHQDISD